VTISASVSVRGSFDDLVGAHEERRRDREAESFGRFHVDREVEMRGP